MHYGAKVSAAKLLSGVIAVAGLNEVSLLMEGQVDLMIAVGGGFLSGGVAEAVLGSQFFSDLVVDLGDVLIFLDLKDAASCLLCHTLEDLLAVDVFLPAGVVAAVIASATAAGITTARIATTRVATAWVATAGIAS